MALSKVTYVDGVTIIGAKNLNDIQDELIRQGEQQAEDEAELALKANTADVQTAIQEAVEEAVKESEYSNFEMKSVSGDFIHITDGAGLIPVKDLKIGIDAVQEGTGDPSPENIRPISGWTEAEVRVCGVNILDVERLDAVTTKSGNTRYGTLFNKAGTYALNAYVTPSSNIYIYGNIQNADGTWEDTTYEVVKARTINPAVITITNGQTLYLYNAIGDGINGTKTRFRDVQMQVAVGNTQPNEFHPFISTDYEVTWQTEAGTVYGGTVDFTTGELTVTHELFALDGVTSGHKFAGVSSSDNPNGKPAYLTMNIAKTPCICDKMVWSNDSVSTMLANTFGGNSGSSTAWYFCIGDSSVTDLTTANAWLESNPLSILKPLVTPQTYQLTPTEVLTLLGENNIFADTGAVEELIYRISRQ